jgi:hypothetical protein
MYQSHPRLVEPADDVALWRYMSFTKFLAFLETRALHMAALTSFEDPFEGHPPKSVVDAFSRQPPGMSDDDLQKLRVVVENNLKMFQNTRKYVTASCWHMSSAESAGMWAQYLRSGEGIAVRTTFARLKSALTPGSAQVTGAVVQYVDFETYEPHDVNILLWAALKRVGFEHEREFRLLSLADPNPRGFLVEVDLPTLVESVYLAPTTPDWIVELLTAVLARYSLHVSPLRSRMADGPAYFSAPAWVRGG